jgi:homeobox protein cut-like
MISTLDNTASEIVQYQRDSTVQRKDLAQKTKDFRKLDDSAKLGEIKGLLKGWLMKVLPVEVKAHTLL